MTDKNDFHDDHDEFKFDDDMHDTHDFADHDEQPFAQDDHAESKQSTTSTKASSSKLDSLIEKLPEKLQNKRVLFAIIVVIVLIIFYGLFGGSDNASNSMTSINDSATTKNAGFSKHDANLGQKKATLTDEFAVKKAPKPVHVTPVAKQSISKNQLNRSLKTVAADIAQQNQAQLQTLSDKFSAQLNDLQTQNQVLSDSVAKLKKQVSGYKSAIHGANNKITALQKRVLAFQHGYQDAFNANGTAHYHAVSKAKATKAVAMPTTYTVQAIVPGRAWLYGSDKQTITVGIGDTVPGYGQVMAIDASAGTVSLTNGAVLKPGA